ncbi:MAG TPA: hypothetical protein VGV59_16880 [Pyrinomonadaceae bacterium]|nr:hypothetical protein [Pyrinomonadaceae bacterium]
MNENPERLPQRAVVGDDEQTHVSPAGRSSLPQPNLGLCPDCRQLISHQAESCPHCGRFIQRFASKMVVERKGWISTIAWGILLAVVIPWLILLALAFLFLIGGVGGRSLLR